MELNSDPDIATNLSSIKFISPAFSIIYSKNAANNFVIINNLCIFAALKDKVLLLTNLKKIL